MTTSSRSTRACSWTPCKTDRKSTRLNSSHQIISYAVFCLKKKKQKFYKRNAFTQTGDLANWSKSVAHRTCTTRRPGGSNVPASRNLSFYSPTFDPIYIIQQ